MNCIYLDAVAGVSARQAMIRPAIWFRGTTWSAAPRRMASLGMPKTTQLFSSCARVGGARGDATVNTELILRPLNSPALNGVSDISDMNYQASQGVLYAIYDSANLLRAMNPDGTLIKEWNLPGNDQEGLTLEGNELYIGEDYGNGGNVFRYSNFVGVPEPATVGLLALGGLMALRRRR